MPWAAGLAVSLIGTGLSYMQQRKAQKAQEEAAQQQNNLADLENRKARIQAVREARIKRQQMIAAAGATGSMESSGLAGGTSSLASQLGSNVGFANQRQAISTNVMNLTNKATKAENQAGIYSAIGDIGDTIFSDLGGYNNLFDKQKKFR